MLLGLSMLLFLAGEPAAATEPPKVRLICRDEAGVSALLPRRRLCLTQEEWDQRARREQEASRRSIYELMGNTACLNGGICTIE
jgi:hypothetical protein